MYLLSIIIPTKNREKYCLEAIKQIMAICDEKKTKEIEIVIQDNSDTDSIRKEVEKLRADNIRYNYSNKVLSFVDNFSEAVSFATGEYLCMIGDDDGILPNIIDVVEYAKENDIKAVVPGLNIVYIWPIKNSFIKNGDNGYLYASRIKSKQKFIKTKDPLIRMLKNGGQKYQESGVLRIYHGIIHRSLLNKIYEQTGKYFGGLTPDIYMATALSFVCEEALRIDYPVTISGICSGSGSANSATGKHTGKLSNAPHFVGHTEYKWSSMVPEIYTVETIWADSVIHAIEDFEPEKVTEFRIAPLLALCYAKYPQFKNELNEFRKKHKISKCYIIALSVSMSVYGFIKRCWRRITRNKKNFFKIYNVENISKAGEILIEKISILSGNRDYNKNR